MDPAPPEGTQAVEHASRIKIGARAFAQPPRPTDLTLPAFMPKRGYGVGYLPPHTMSFGGAHPLSETRVPTQPTRATSQRDQTRRSTCGEKTPRLPAHLSGS